MPAAHHAIGIIAPKKSRLTHPTLLKIERQHLRKMEFGSAAIGVTRRNKLEMLDALLQSFPIATEHMQSCH